MRAKYVAKSAEKLTVPSPSKRELIVAAARKLFLGTGFGSTSMDAIAAEAGVSKRTVYSHFQNKETLFAAIMRGMCQAMSGLNPEEPIPDAPPQQVLKSIGLHILHGVLDPEALDLFRVVLAESPTFPELGKAFWEAGPEVMKSFLSQYLSGLDRQGVLSVPDPDLAAFQFIGMVKWPHHTRLLFGAGNRPTAKKIDAALDQAIAIFLGGLKPSN